MHLVVTQRWPEVTAEIVRALAAALKVTGFDARPRLIGSGPVAAACFADSGQARTLGEKLKKNGFAGFVPSPPLQVLKPSLRFHRDSKLRQFPRFFGGGPGRHG